MSTTKPYQFKPLNMGRIIVWGLFALVMLLAPVVFTSSLSLTMLTLIGIAIIICLAYNMLMGQGGMLSFGYAVYVGLGAFCAIHTLNAIGAGKLPIPVSLLPIVGGLGGMALALFLGWVSTKKAGATFAMITLGVGELAYAAALLFTDFFGGESGISSNRMVGSPFLGLTDSEGKALITFGPQIQVYYLIAAYCFVCTGLMFAFTRTPLGRILNAVRDNPERVEFVGYNTQLVRYITFVISGFFAGVAGGLMAINQELIQAQSMGAYASGGYMVFTYLGGGFFFFGPIIGGILSVLAFVILSKLTKAWLFYVGLAFILMVMYAPHGLSGVVMMNLRVYMFKRLHRLLLPYVAVLSAAAVLLTGLAATIEMVYHKQFNAQMTPELSFFGYMLNVEQSQHWIAVLATLVVGAVLFEFARRYVKRHWDRVQEEIEAIIRMKETA
jgi:branched-chain amino acid transport system permease protein